MPATGPKNWTCPRIDFRGLTSNNSDDRHYEQRALNKARFVPYPCRPNRERPKRLRIHASHRHVRSRRESGCRSRSALSPCRSTKATSGGGSDDGGDDGGPGEPPPTPELLAFVDDLAVLAADLFLAASLRTSVAQDESKVIDARAGQSHRST